MMKMKKKMKRTKKKRTKKKKKKTTAQRRLRTSRSIMQRNVYNKAVQKQHPQMPTRRLQTKISLNQHDKNAIEAVLCVSLFFA